MECQSGSKETLRRKFKFYLNDEIEKILSSEKSIYSMQNT